MTRHDGAARRYQGWQALDGWALLDWNESPLGPSPLAVRAVREAAAQLHRYPRGLLDDVCELTAIHLGVAHTQVLLTAGVDEAVDIALSLADAAWGVQPGFDGYPDRAAAQGKPFRPIALGADWHPIRTRAGSLAAGDMVFIAQPNNPTGNFFDARWLADIRRTAGYLFLDETYQEFSSRPSIAGQTARDPRLLVYRSFSKALGLAGIRLGCLVGHPETIEALRPLRRFYPIDSVSLHAAAATLADGEFTRRLVSYVIEARADLARILADCGAFACVRQTEANFVIAQPFPSAAPRVLSALERDCIRVKPCDSLGLPGWLRVSVGSPEDQRRLGAALAGIGQAAPVTG
jgi:histidinol-phosphate/aromatic aminotransferase/cobyric acid decarboxylase-like protein